MSDPARQALPGSLVGFRVIESPYLTESGEPYQQLRPWRKRLFSRPWRPLQRTVTVVPQVPYRGALQINKTTLVMHPDTLRYMRVHFNEESRR